MKRILALISVSAMMLALTAVPALAQPVFTGGLVNVTVTDVIDDVEVVVGAVQLPIGVAANVCDVNVAVLVEDFQDGTANCTADQDSVANAPGAGRGNR